jgi:hypothetical protein
MSGPRADPSLIISPLDGGALTLNAMFRSSCFTTSDLLDAQSRPSVN